MGTRSTTDPFYQELGKSLKKARLNAGLTYSQAAASADLSSSNAIGRYENATRTPDIKTLAALSSAYQINESNIINEARSAATQIKKGQDGTSKEKEE